MSTPTVTAADRERAEAGVQHTDYSGHYLGRAQRVTFWATEFARDRETLEAAKDKSASLSDALGTVRGALDRFDANLAFMDDGVVLLGTRASQAKARIEQLEATLGVESGLLVDAKQRVEELEAALESMLDLTSAWMNGVFKKAGIMWTELPPAVNVAKAALANKEQG